MFAMSCHARTWILFVLGVAVLMGALLIGPRVAEDQQAWWCVGNVHLKGPFGFSLNCDSPLFMALARDPSALFDPDNVRQSRPGLIAAAAIIRAPLSLLIASHGLPAASLEHSLRDDPDEVSQSFERDLPAYLAYIALNVAILFAAFYILQRIISPTTMDDSATCIIVAASGLLLVANDVTKGFVWSPHTQMFNILVPLLALYGTLRAWRGAMRDPRFALAIGVISGMGLTAYPIFVVIPTCVIPAALAALVWDRSDAPVVVTKLFLIVALTIAPWTLWFFYARSITGGFFIGELGDREVVWMADSWANGMGAFMIDWFAKAWQLIVFATQKAIPLFVVVVWLMLAVAFDRRSKCALRSVATVAILAAYVSVAVGAFYTCVGLIVDRLAYPIIPPLLAAAAVASVTVARKMDYRHRWLFAAGYALVGVAQLVYVVAEDGPWS